MSWVTLSPAEERPGHLVCACDLTPSAPSDSFDLDGPSLAVTAGMFALTVLGQGLSTAVLPAAGLVLAPRTSMAVWPYALTLVGAGIATLPAAALTDLFGRRAALALGASLGLAGGALAARSFAGGQFFGLALGAFWLGVAQGFGFFYRHAGVSGGRDKSRTIAAILSSGALAALAAPGVIVLAQSAAGPLAPAVALLCAGAVQVAVLALAMMTMGGGGVRARIAATSKRKCPIVAATAAAAVAWFGMAALMAHAAPNMALCGVGAAAASGLIASHILSMYAPAAIVGPWVERLGAGKVAAVGLLAVLCAFVEARRATTAPGFEVTMFLAGCGWALTMLGATLTIHEGGSPSPRTPALHDGVLFAAAVAGALTFDFGR